MMRRIKSHRSIVGDSKTGAKISEADVAIGVEKHVVRFDVAMNVAQPMDRRDRQYLRR